MNDFIRFILEAENLIRTLSGFVAESSRSIEYFLPGRIVGHLVDDGDVMHLKF